MPAARFRARADAGGRRRGNDSLMTTTEKTTQPVRAKEFHFPVGVEWIGSRRVLAKVEGKHPIEVTPPPEFRGTDPTTWSPEDFFVAAAASCLAVTFTGLAERAGLAFSGLSVHGDGVAGKRDDGAFGFTRLLLTVDLHVAPGTEEQARELALRAEETCLVSESLDQLIGQLRDALEILAISGVVADYHVHAHMVLSNRERAFGGHLEPGCRVFSLVELAIARLDHLKLQRQLDAETKQKLLQVVERYEGTTADAAYSLVDTAGHTH